MSDRRWAWFLLWLIVFPSAAAAAEFVADIVITEDRVVKTGRILVQGERYRLEIEDPRGPEIVVQVPVDLERQPGEGAHSGHDQKHEHSHGTKTD